MTADPIRLALPIELYPALPYRGDGIERIEPCACGGSVVQWRNEDIAHAVRAHNATPVHQAWRDAR